MRLLKLIGILFIVFIVISSCDDHSDDSLCGEWRIEKYNSIDNSSYELTEVTHDQNCCLQFNNSGTFSCSTDCNAIYGRFTKENNKISFSNIYFTELACDTMIIERSIITLLPNISSVEVKNDSILIFKNASGNTLIDLGKKDNRTDKYRI